MTGGTISFDEFARRMADSLDIEPDDIVSEARFDEDLGLDSYDLVELVTMVEELGAHLPDDVVVGIDTVGDLYREYEQRTVRPTE